MFQIRKDCLRPGDIILSKSDSRESQIIRKRSESDFSHAILYVGNMSCIESDGLGVQANNLQRIFVEKEGDVSILRFNGDNESPIIEETIDFARRLVGTEYSTQEAKRATQKNIINPIEVNRQYCTRFVAQAFDSAGVKLVENVNYCTPQNLIESEFVTKIEPQLFRPTQEQIDYFKNAESPLEKQVDIMNQMLEEIRNLTGADIQTFEQLFNYVIEHSHHEPKITKILKESGYLEMWKWDMDLNPWWYDPQAFVSHITNANQRKEMASFFATTEIETRDRFERTLQMIIPLYVLFRLEFFKVLIALYEKLIELSKLRQQVGKSVLNS